MISTPLRQSERAPVYHICSIFSCHFVVVMWLLRTVLMSCVCFVLLGCGRVGLLGQLHHCQAAHA